jgi:phosphoribosylglycinamide formyltransferase 1
VNEGLPAAVFASGGGTNLQALLDHEATGASYRISLVVSDREGAGALDRAERAGRRRRVIPVAGREAAEVEAEMLVALEDARIEVIFLAGYLRLVPSGVVSRFRRRILNVHPALLPAFGGKGMYGHHVHEAVVRAGVAVTGATVHYVDEEYDKGTIVAQWPVPVRPDDDAGAVAARILRVEHALYPAAADHVAEYLQRGEDPQPFCPRGELFSASGGDAETLRSDLEAGFSGG